MPDRDDLGGAWRVTPTEYLARRPATFAVPAPLSRYVEMRDGCRLAVDAYVPEGQPGSRFPTVLILTPYYRRFALSGPGAEPSPNAARYRDTFVPRGYAVVVVDVRGTGASFGTRDSFRSPLEVGDHREIADWIVAQPWSDGAIGSTGISYLGAAACFLASTGHPAVKAIAPLFSVHDTYADHVFPGGLKCTTVTENYDALVQALDLDQRGNLKKYAYFADPRYAGPQPVDEDRDGSLARAAVEEHHGSFRMRDLAPELAFREEAAPHDPALHSGACSPYWYFDEKVRGKVAIYSVSGWYDGSQFANGAIARYLTNAGPHDRLLLGPWDHGARGNGSPWRKSALPEFNVLAEVLRFFDQHLAGRETGLADEAPIHFHTVHGEKWQAASHWPPHEATSRWHLDTDGTLIPRKPSRATKVPYQVRFTTGTGTSTRFERLSALAVDEFYADWGERSATMLSFTSSPFETEAELTGHAILELAISTSEHDGSVFAYLSEVEADGRVRYVTEGALRMLHRATAECPPTYRTTWPWRTFHRADAERMPPGVPQVLRFALLPISWTFSKGSCLRLSIAGTDADHFAQVPHGRPPRFEVAIGPSFLDLPFRAEGA